MNERFYPYDPRELRLRLVLVALPGLALAAWSLHTFSQGGGVPAMARAGAALGLVLTLGLMWSRLLPRRDFGVTLSALGVKVVRPLSGAAIELGWDDIQRVSRSVGQSGKKRSSLLLWTGPEERVLVGPHLFASESEFEALAGAIEHRKPRPILDS